MSAPGDRNRSTPHAAGHPSAKGKPASRPAHHAARRLAELIVSVIDCDQDPTTLKRWGELATPSMSRGSVRALCYAAGVRPRDAHVFARLLRDLNLRFAGDWPVGEFIDTRDARTMQRLVARSGLTNDVRGIETFLRDQQLIGGVAVLAEIRSALVRRR
jgi:hypothetical protein